MWLLKLIDISGVGSELGVLSLLLILVLAWFIHRERTRLEKKIDNLVKQHKEMYEDYKFRRHDQERDDQAEKEHKEMYEDYIVRRRRNSSGAHALNAQDMENFKAQIIAEIMKGKG